jgi:hypothetical protein
VVSSKLFGVDTCTVSSDLRPRVVETLGVASFSGAGRGWRRSVVLLSPAYGSSIALYIYIGKGLDVKIV